MAPASTGQVPDLLTGNNTIDETQWEPVLTPAIQYLTFDANSSSSGTSPKFFGCAFTSTTANYVLQDNHKGLLLGLNPSKNANIQPSSIDVVNKFGVTGVTSGSISKILSEVLHVKVTSTTDMYRNGLWIIPLDTGKLQIAVRLSFSPMEVNFTDPNFLPNLADALRNEFGITVPTLDISALDLVMIFTSISTWTASGMASTSSYSLTVMLPEIGVAGSHFDFYVSIDNLGGSQETTLALKQSPSNHSSPSSAISSVSQFSNTSIGMPSDTSGAVPQWNGVFDTIFLWYVDVNVTQKAWDIAIILEIPIITPSKPLPIFLVYNSSAKKFSGGIWTTNGINASNSAIPVFPIDPDSGLLLPTYQEYHGLPGGFSRQPTAAINLNDVLDLALPAGLPTNIVQGTVIYNSGADGSQKRLDLTLDLDAPSGTDPSDVPTPFKWEGAQFIYSKTSSPDHTDLDIKFDFKLNPPTGSPIPAATMNVGLKYDTDEGKKTWLLTGDVAQLNLALLSQFMDPGLISAMRNVVLTNVHVEYSYEGSTSQIPSTTAFIFTGEIDLTNPDTGKGLKLDMFYQYSNKASVSRDLIKGLAGRNPPITVPSGFEPPPTDDKTAAWKFDAFLSPSTDTSTATLGDVIDAIVANNLPSFIKSIPLSKTGSTDVATIRAYKDTVSNEVVFEFDVSLGILEFTFVQVASTANTSDDATRILRLSVGPLPLFTSIPVINQLPQPYQLLTYCWVSKDVSKTDLVSLNNAIVPISPFYYKNTDQNQTAALREGHHFIVIDDNNACVLDHVFKTSTDTEPGQPAAMTSLMKRAVAAQPTEDNATNPPTTGSVQKTTPLLSISGISLQYSQGTLWLFFDATAHLGPKIELDLIGFGIGVKLVGDGAIHLSDLSHLDSAIQVQLHGMAMNFSQPPVRIAGVFEHIATSTVEEYRGGIAVGLDPYDFVAVGEYAKVKQNGNEYKSIFIYARLDGPLIDLEIAIIEGVRLGFGYNSFVRTPTVQELAQFPFITDSGVSGSGPNPMAILTAMRGGDNPWVQMMQDSYWFAFGLSVSAFDLLTATAVALVDLTPRGVEVAIFADVTGQMPPSVPMNECIVYIELLMEADLSFINDSFVVQAALAPTSFLLVPQCQLLGGFAMGSWFGHSDYAGDWVYTVGGYHKQFAAPSYYPQPHRLEISFSIGDDLSLTGTGYFAITPKAVMGGAGLYIQLSVGPIRAWTNCSFDALVQFHPLHYVLDVDVDVGVSLHIHAWFVSVDFGGDIEVRIHIEGPSFGGGAHVDVLGFGFDIYFGASPSPPPPIPLDQFYDILMKAGPPAGPKTDDDTSKDYDIELKYALEDGAFPAPPNPKDAASTDKFPDSGQTKPWRVRANFTFRISTVFALSGATIIGDTAAANAVVPADSTANAAITSIPMQMAQPIDSEMSIVITSLDGGKNTLISGWQASFVVKDVPTAMWGDPNHPPDALNPSQKSTVPRQMAVSLTSPPPLLSRSRIPPVNATDINNLTLPDHRLEATETQSAMLPATLDKTPSTWPTMQTAWENAATTNGGVASNLVTECMKALFWDHPAPDVALKTKDKIPQPWVLTSKFPTRLVAGTGQTNVADGLENTYLALPRVVAV